MKHRTAVFGWVASVFFFLALMFAAPGAWGADISNLEGLTGKIGKEDVQWGTGQTTDTYTVPSYDGSTVTLTKLPSLDAATGSIIKGTWYVSNSASITDHGDGTQTGSLKWVLNQIGTEARREVELPGNTLYPVATDLTVPGNVALRFQPGAVLSIASGRTLTVNGPLEAGPWQIFGGAGTVIGNYTQTRATLPEWFGAVPDGSTDCTDAFRKAHAFSSGYSRILLQGGTYLVTDTISSTALRWHLEGPRVERGANCIAIDMAYPSAVIKFSPVDTSKYLLKSIPTAALNPGKRGGPYVATNITFDLRSGASLFMVDAKGASTPAFGFHMEGCAVQGVAQATASNEDSSGNITRNGQKFVHLDQVHEPTVENCSMNGGDVQLDFYSVDHPNILRVRSQYAHIPYYRHFTSSDGSNGNAVIGIVSGLHVETYTFGAVANEGCNLFIDDLRCEQNVGTWQGSRVLSQTAAVTAGSDTLTFSGDVSRILFPNLSLIRLDDGAGNAEYAIVKTVSPDGLTVTTYSNPSATGDAYNHTFTFSAAAATVTRYHGYAVLGTYGGKTTVNGASLGVSTTAPVFVFQPQWIQGVKNVEGQNRGTPAVLVGNRWTSGTFMDGCVTFEGVSPRLLPHGGHPLAVVSGFKNLYGEAGETGSARPKYGTIPDLALAARHWVWSPRSGGTSTSSQHRTPWLLVSGEARTGETVWAWRLDATYRYLDLYNATLPSKASGWYRLKVRARAASGTPALLANAKGYTGSPNVGAFVLGTEWATYESVFSAPSPWTHASRTAATNAGISLDGGTNIIYVAAVSIEELDECARLVKGAVSAALSGATTDITLSIPSGARIEAVALNVDADITGATSWAAAFITGNTTSIGTGLALAKNTKAAKVLDPNAGAVVTTAATNIRVTAAGGTFTGGVVRARVWYSMAGNIADAS